MSGEGEALWNLCHVVSVAHPGDALLRQSAEELAGRVKEGDGFPVLPGGIILRRRDQTAQSMGDELTAVANAQNGNAQCKDGRVVFGRVVKINAVRSAGEDNADGRLCAQRLQRGSVGAHLTVDAALPYPAGDELIVLSAEIQNDDCFVCHAIVSFLSGALIAPTRNGPYSFSSSFLAISALEQRESIACRVR